MGPSCETKPILTTMPIRRSAFPGAGRAKQSQFRPAGPRPKARTLSMRKKPNSGQWNPRPKVGTPCMQNKANFLDCGLATDLRRDRRLCETKPIPADGSLSPRADRSVRNKPNSCLRDPTPRRELPSCKTKPISAGGPPAQGGTLACKTKPIPALAGGTGTAGGSAQNEANSRLPRLGRGLGDEGRGGQLCKTKPICPWEVSGEDAQPTKSRGQSCKTKPIPLPGW